MVAEGQNPHQPRSAILSFDDYELMDYVKEHLNRGDHCNAIVRSMNVTCQILSRRLVAVSWGGVCY